MGGAADQTACQLRRSTGRAFRSKPRRAHEPRIWVVVQFGDVMRAW
jgi:hypothetical protein